VPPRTTPDRDSRYMGEAWLKAAFSKDPSTQVGAVIIDRNNIPWEVATMGHPSLIDDNSFSWERPAPDFLGLSKYDLVVHAEINAMDHCQGNDLTGATLYVTACLVLIVCWRLSTSSYIESFTFDFQSSLSSSLQNAAWRDKSFAMAQRAGIQLEKFTGNLNWIPEWVQRLKDIGIVNT
jgi:deoxycytidylate deaminase